MVSLISLVVSAALPVVNVFLMCLVGFALARKGVLDGRARQAMSQLIFWVFVPSLVFTKLADSVNLNNLATWWILPVNMIISISIGLLIGWAFAKVLKVDDWFRKHFMCSVALGNVGNLPIVLVQSICSNGKSPYSQLLPNGTCEQKGIAYVAFSMWIASTFQYCIAFNMLKKPGDAAASTKIAPSTAPLSSSQSDGALQLVPLRKAPSEGASLGKAVLEKDAKTQKNEVSILIEAGQGEGMAGEGQHLHRKSPEARSLDSGSLRDAESERLINADSSSTEVREETANMQGTSSYDYPDSQWWEHNQAGHALRKKKQKEIQRWLRGIPWGSYLNMPTLAAIAGLSVGCISAIRVLLFGDSPPLLFLTQSLQILAGGMIPMMMMIMGASLAKGPGNAKLSKRVILGCLIVRLVVMPAIGTGVVMAMLKMGLFTAPDPLFLLVLLLCHSPPTAMNLQTVCTLNENGEEEMSALLCWQYLAALITLPLWMLLFVTITSP